MPKRRAIPAYIKRLVRNRQNDACGCRGNCGYVLPPDGLGLVQYQHEPPLALRQVLPDDSDWLPSQHDPRYIYAELKECHRVETYGASKATSLGSDRHAIDKMKRLTGVTCNGPKKKIQGRTRLQSRPFRNDWKPNVRDINDG